MQANELKDFVVAQLEELKAKDLKVLEVTEKTSIADYMVICSGTSTRHVKSIAIQLVKTLKEHDIPPIGIEGEGSAEWVLVDCADVIAHIMLPQSRDYYQLEKLWG